MPQSMRREAVFCSSECNYHAHALKRKLRSRTGQGMTGWLRAEIFKRDKWKCGVCRKKVRPELRYPDPGAPSLDHVIPIAEGGDNEPANLRLTHLRCNLSRRHYGGNEQLALI
jgi:5-methylcytosine-specific restriction endonuclease McrA